MKTFRKYIIILILAYSGVLAAAFQPCSPDTPDRFFMGRGTRGQCLYAEGNAAGEVYE